MESLNQSPALIHIENLASEGVGSNIELLIERMQLLKGLFIRYAPLYFGFTSDLAEKISDDQLLAIVSIASDIIAFVNLSRMTNLTESGVCNLLKITTQLKHLDLTGCTQFSAEFITKIRQDHQKLIITGPIRLNVRRQ